MSTTIRIDTDGYPMSDGKGYWKFPAITLTGRAANFPAMWWSTPYHVDHNVSGIWADYMEDHPEEVEGDPEAVARLVAFLRLRFNRPRGRAV